MIAKVSKQQTVRILILAHRPIITEELISWLPLNTELKIVCEKYQFISELLYNGPELIIVDGNTPCLNGVEALFLARKAFPDIPFVMLYEPYDPFFAAEALIEGASSCIAMNEFPKLETIMKEAQEQHPEHKLHIASRRIVQQIKDNIAGLDQIRDSLGEVNDNDSDLYSTSIKAEIDNSIDYLEQLENKMKTKAA